MPTATASGEQAPKELAAHGWFVQLGAVSSTAAAQTEWTRLKRTQADLLASLSANAVRVERGGGMIYRIEAGPLADADAASRLCRSLQQRHVACIVLRP
ncbi:MAG: SPOR domain-containing protein [Stellaceae bacterium]